MRSIGLACRVVGEERVDVHLVRLDPSEPVVAGLMRVFGLDASTARALLARVPARVKRNVTLADALRIRDALEALGGEVRLDAPADIVPSQVRGAAGGEPRSEPPVASLAPPSSSRPEPMRPPPDPDRASLEPLMMRGYSFEMDESASTPLELEDRSAPANDAHDGRLYDDKPKQTIELGLDAQQIAALGPSARKRQSDRPYVPRPRVGVGPSEPPSYAHPSSSPPAASPSSRPPALYTLPATFAAASQPAPATSAPGTFAPLSSPPSPEAGAPSPSVRPLAPSSPIPGAPLAPTATLDPPRTMPRWAMIALGAAGVVAAGSLVTCAVTSEDPVRIVRTSSTGATFDLEDESPESVDRWAAEMLSEPGTTRAEARGWLRAPLHSLANVPDDRARALVDDLYRAGAKRVEIHDAEPLFGTHITATLIAESEPTTDAAALETAAARSLSSLADYGVEILRGERYLVIVTD
jgi:hypothetical protein